jgi:hypothetical protein
MRRIIVGIVALGFSQALAARPADAQARGYVDVGGGVGFPTGRYNDLVKTGWLGQVAAGITGPRGKFGGRIDGTFAKNEFALGVGSLRFMGVMGDLVLSPRNAARRTRPYLLGGIGFQSARNSLTATSDTKFAFNAGLGVTVRVGRGSSIYAEGRFLSVRTSPDVSNLFPISAGVRLGGR